MTVDETILAVEESLKTIRIPATGAEYDLHGMIAKALSDAKVDCVHECGLGPCRRIDFLVGEVGIEVKRGRVSRRLVLPQLERYLDSELVQAMIVVSTRQLDLPSRIRGKRVVSFGLSRLWGVALP